MFSKYKWLLVFFFVFLLSFVRIERPELVLSKIQNFDIDIFGNFTVVSGTKVMRFDTNSIEKFYFQNLSLGNAASINSDDVLNSMLFYPDVQSIVFLDNSLSMKNSPVKISDLGFDNVSVACLSYNTGFWLYNSSTFSLHRFDRFLKETNVSSNINQLLSVSPNPTSLKEKHGILVLNDSEKGLIVFDHFGNFIKQLNISEIKDFQITPNSIEFLRHDSLFRFDMKFNQIDSLGFLGTNAVKYSKFNQILFFLDNEGNLYKRNI
jgi:hypothetical protein